MKKFIQFLNLKEKNNSNISLRKELLKKLREHFNLRMQLKLGQLKKMHMLKIVSRNIASIKYYLYRK